MRKPSRAGRRQVTIAALLFLMSLLLFWPSRTAAFVWDDLPYNLAGNPALMRGDYGELWRRPYRDFYIPITYSAWTLIAHTTAGTNGENAALDPESFHTVNLFVH